MKRKMVERMETCAYCDGMGAISVYTAAGEDQYDNVSCPACHGSGVKKNLYHVCSECGHEALAHIHLDKYIAGQKRKKK